MELPWTTAEEEILISLVHSVECGGVCRVVRSWVEIADLMTARASDLGHWRRVYTKTNVAHQYSQIPKESVERVIKEAAVRMAGAEGNPAKPLVPRLDGFGSRKLPTPRSSPKLMERATQAAGPPKDFDKYKIQKD